MTFLVEKTRIEEKAESSNMILLWKLKEKGKREKEVIDETKEEYETFNYHQAKEKPKMTFFEKKKRETKISK